MKHPIQHLRRIGKFALVTLVLACGTDSPLPLAPNALDMSGASAAVARSARTVSVETQLEREKRRIAFAQEASKPMYDALKVTWDQYLKLRASVRESGLFPMCDPLQYVGEVKIIGVEGGTIDFGPHKLVIPRNALKTRTVITAEAPTSLKVEAKFSPHGTQFDKRYPVRLELSYKHCQGLRTLPKKIVYVNDQFQIIEFPLSQLKSDEGLVEAWINHFSGYVVAW